MQEKQKLRAHYALTESQLRNSFLAAKRAEGKTNENLMRRIETRLDAVVYHSGMAPTIFAAKQIVNHRHIKVDGRVVDRGSYQLKPGQVVSIDVSKSPMVAEIAKGTAPVVPPYFEVNKDQLTVKLVREPMIEEIPVNVEAMRVVEYYAQ